MSLESSQGRVRQKHAEVAPRAVERAGLRFSQFLSRHDIELRRARPEILQLNLGKLCNLTCSHCHVNAGPKRKEIMSWETGKKILAWLEGSEIGTVDLTGGAPEMIPAFRPLVEGIRRRRPRCRIIDRCNLTILLEPGYEWLADFLVAHRVEVVASMPCYTPENVNAQRGEGVFDSSIRALQSLNALGYGRAEDRVLDLVYNPAGAFLPGSQEELEADYKRELEEHFGIVFNRLYTITNMPIARFAAFLRRSGRYKEYLQLLIEAFNPATISGLMCRDTISVSWRGEVFDCDFNQMLGLKRPGSSAAYLWETTPGEWEGGPVATGDHCFGCTAGRGSSCGGALQ